MLSEGLLVVLVCLLVGVIRTRPFPFLGLLLLLLFGVGCLAFHDARSSCRLLDN